LLLYANTFDTFAVLRDKSAEDMDNSATPLARLIHDRILFGNALKNVYQTKALDSRWISYLTCIALVASLLFYYSRKEQSVKAPFVGYRRFWEPTIWLRLRFFQGAREVVNEGYEKVISSSLLGIPSEAFIVQGYHVLDPPK